MVNKSFSKYLRLSTLLLFAFLILGACIQSSQAQERLPLDNSFEEYHPAPRYRESESHPLRIFAYAFHPVGWFAREILFRPFSYFVSSNPKRASIFGYRDPHDIRRSKCFSNGDNIPSCKQLDVENYSYKSGTSEVGDSSVNRSDVMDLE